MTLNLVDQFILNGKIYKHVMITPKIVETSSSIMYNPDVILITNGCWFIV